LLLKAHEKVFTAKLSEFGTGPGQDRDLKQQSAQRFEALDSWRGVCALLVALFHFPLAGPIGENAFVRGSFLFVDFFFVLSGFVIAHACTEKAGTGQGLAKFMVTRIGRLFPLHASMLAAFVGFELLRLAVPQLAGGEPPFSGAFSLDTLPANFVLLHGLGIHGHLSWNAPSWSISTELFAYIFFGLAVLLLGKRSLALFSLAAVAGPLILFKYSPDFMDATYDFGLVRCLCGFSAGVLTQALLDGRIDSGPKTREALWTWTLAEFAVIGAVVLFVSTAALNAGGLLAPLMFAFAVALFAHEGGYVSRLMKTKPLLLLGTISYSIYLTHIFVQSRMMNAAKILDRSFVDGILAASKDGASYSQAVAIPAILLMTALTILASFVTYRLIEAPGRDFFKRLAARIPSNLQISHTLP
jgi:peptidoglycan/LPS O-acetylase OafA/YrhL